MLQILERALQIKVGDHGHQNAGHGVTRGVIRAVGRPLLGLVVFDVFRADRRAHKDEIVLEIAAVQYLGGDRVEESLCQLRLVVVDQKSDVVQLDLLPDVHRLLTCFELALQSARALFYPQVVKLDAFALRPLLSVPVCSFKPVLGAGRLGAKQLVVAIEAVHHRLGDVVSNRRIQARGEHIAHFFIAIHPIQTGDRG